ncbi:flagellar protein FlaG [bacterium]|nr:flagellar protein FlaG [bacterium]
MTDRVIPTESLVTGAASSMARSASAEVSRRADPRNGATEQLTEAAGNQAPAAEKLSEEDSSALLQELNRLLEVYDLEARYYIDESTERRVVQIKDARSKRLIRQVPSQDFLDNARTLHELMGLLFDKKA